MAGAIALADLRAAYRVVDQRDEHVCQVTGVPLEADHSDAKQALTRHHLDERSSNRDRQGDPDNILTVSLYVHRLMHGHALLVLDGAGRETTRVSEIARFEWDLRFCPRGRAPFSLIPGSLHISASNRAALAAR